MKAVAWHGKRDVRVEEVPDPGIRAVAEAGVPALVYASSVGAYSPGPKDRSVDESWPVLDAQALARALGARVVRLPQAVARTALSASWRLRLQPTPPGWLDMGLGVPIMDTTRASEELDSEPRHSSVQAIRDVLGGIADAQGESTPPLETTRR